MNLKKSKRESLRYLFYKKMMLTAIFLKFGHLKKSYVAHHYYKLDISN